MSTLLVVVVALFLAWIAFKAIRFLTSLFLKLLFFGILAAIFIYLGLQMVK